jgi:nitrogen fixation-related uncharacterized protein
MPPWGWFLDKDIRLHINTYEMSFVLGSTRTVSGDIYDQEGDDFNEQYHPVPGIAGAQQDHAGAVGLVFPGFLIWGIRSGQFHNVEEAKYQVFRKQKPSESENRVNTEVEEHEQA